MSLQRVLSTSAKPQERAPQLHSSEPASKCGCFSRIAFHEKQQLFEGSDLLDMVFQILP